MELKELIPIIQAVTGIASVLIAVTALFMALRVENRNHKRFETQLELTKKTAAANVKPILAIFTSEFIDLKALTLFNLGSGTAIVTSISFSRGDVVAKNMSRLFNFKRTVMWDNFWAFSDSKYYLRAGQDVSLVKLSAKNLVNQGLNEMEAVAVLTDWQQQLEGITVKITYEDIFGNKQKDYERTFKS